MWDSPGLKDQVRHLRVDLCDVDRQHTERMDDLEDMLLELAERLGYRFERETRKYILVEKEADE